MGDKTKESTLSRNNMDKVMHDLNIKKEAPLSAFILLLVLYTLATFFTIAASRTRGTIVVFDNQVAIASFAGAFSSMSNICVICLAVLFRKPGFIISLILLLLQFPMMIINIFLRHVTTNLPGLFMNFFTIIAVIIIYVSHRKVLQYQKGIRDQAIKDRLTGLPNRFATTELMEDMVKRNEKFALVAIDLNDFKSINDTMGHETGNVVLQRVADRWVRLSDAMKNGVNVFVSRISGDEYLLLISGYTYSDDIEKIINEFKNELERKMTIDGCDYFLTACFGYTEFPADDNNVDSLLLFADAALHEAKRMSTTSILKFKPDLLNTEKALETERKIRYALENNTVTFNLQPQFDINHKLRGFESLARMKDQDGNPVSPGEFIPVAEKCGLIDKVDMRVFELSMEFLSNVLRAKKDSDIIVSCNVSVRHLMKNNFIEELKDVIVKYQIPTSHVEIEITESVMIDSLEKALQRIDEIKDMGMKIAIDDFGTGYSSLSYLNNFPSDLLKIDKSFIDLMNTSESSKQYVATIISIGHILNLHVISEGVEDEAQIDTLREIGCDYIQGFIWGKPMPANDALEIVFA
ncbi:MAG: bifunctional diguanylate cyclase/phosphodiesterase [Clostridiales bacterium]|jgi:diguanylate cyclase (GGDEF)-like protein|nr:bifunctional diguanylate cyclase/phosphodiesterase [Clostridiales bacterium]